MATDASPTTRGPAFQKPRRGFAPSVDKTAPMTHLAIHRIEPSPAPPGCVRRIHDDLHVARVREASRRAPVVLDGDTVAGRLVSVLEGGYDIDAVGESAAEHVRALIS